LVHKRNSDRRGAGAAVCSRNFAADGLAKMRERLAKPAETLAFCYADTTIPRKFAADFLQMQQTAKPPTTVGCIAE
jgi:hypothetical protein